MLPSEMLKKRDKPIRIRIGKPVSAKVIEDCDDAKELGEFLRKKVYMMRSYYERRKSITELFKL
jgi:S-adenosylmethionine synthetase